MSSTAAAVPPDVGRASPAEVIPPEVIGGSAVDPDAPPKAAFNVAKNGLTINLTSTSTDDDAVVSHAWDFGDGGTSSQADPSHVYDAAGTYDVKLTVTDGSGQTDSVTKSVSVEVPALKLTARLFAVLLNDAVGLTLATVVTA